MIAAEGRRDPQLAAHVDGWLADLEQQDQRRELLYSINDYAVLLHKPICDAEDQRRSAGPATDPLPRDTHLLQRAELSAEG